MMLYYEMKFGCKWTNSLEDIVKIVKFGYISPRDLDTEDSEPIFLHDTSPRDNTPPYQVWFTKKQVIERFRRY